MEIIHNIVIFLIIGIFISGVVYLVWYFGPSRKYLIRGWDKKGRLVYNERTETKMEVDDIIEMLDNEYHCFKIFIKTPETYVYWNKRYDK